MTIISGRDSSDYSSGRDSNRIVLAASLMVPIAAEQVLSSSKHLLSPQNIIILKICARGSE